MNLVTGRMFTLAPRGVSSFPGGASSSVDAVSAFNAELEATFGSPLSDTDEVGSLRPERAETASPTSTSLAPRVELTAVATAAVAAPREFHVHVHLPVGSQSVVVHVHLEGESR